MKNITEEELAMLEACQVPQDWDRACNEIISARGQSLPDDWEDKLILSGMQDRIGKRMIDNLDKLSNSMIMRNRDGTMSINPTGIVREN